MLEQPHTSSSTSEPEARRHGGPKPPAEPEPPVEYETQHWKHRVEAEARHELKREIHGVGTHSRP